MFGSLVRKELLDTLRSLRFTAGWLMMLVLMVAAVLLLNADVIERKEQIEALEESRADYYSKYAHLNRIGAVSMAVRPPEETEVLFRGLNNPLEDSTFYTDPIAKLFPKLDLTYIVSLLLSLLALVFTYDAVCGEREDGTLRLLHTTSVSRSTVILAKFAGNWIAVGIPFIVVFLFAVVLSSFIGGLPLTAETFIEVGVIAGISLLYVGFFLALGLFVSAIVRHSGTSILILLFLWVVFTLVIPNAAPLVSAQIAPLPSVATVEYQASYITDVERDNRVQEQLRPEIERLNEEYGIPHSVVWNRNTDALNAMEWGREKKMEFLTKWHDVFTAVVDRVNEEQNAKAQALRDDLERMIDLQADLARWFSLLSPTSALVYCGTDLASVGLRAEEHFHDEASAYSRDFDAYLDERMRIQGEKLGRPVGINEKVDLPNWPRFRHRPEPINARLEATIPYLAHLAISMLIALLAAGVVYQRYDIR